MQILRQWLRMTRSLNVILSASEESAFVVAQIFIDP
jgi:hypothetical protein